MIRESATISHSMLGNVRNKREAKNAPDILIHYYLLNIFYNYNTRRRKVKIGVSKLVSNFFW